MQLLLTFKITVFYQALKGCRNVVIKLLPSTKMLDITDARCLWFLLLTQEALGASVVRGTLAGIRPHTAATVSAGQLTHR